MLDDLGLQRLLERWKHQNGVEKYGIMFVPIRGRAEGYKNLVKTLHEIHGYQYDDFTLRLQNKIIDMSIPESAYGKKGEKTWKSTCQADFTEALAAIFPDKFVLLTHDNTNDAPAGSTFKPAMESVAKAPEYVYSAPAENPIELNNPLDVSSSDINKSADVVDVEFLKVLRGENNE